MLHPDLGNSDARLLGLTGIPAVITRRRAPVSAERIRCGRTFVLALDRVPGNAVRLAGLCHALPGGRFQGLVLSHDHFFLASPPASARRGEMARPNDAQESSTLVLVASAGAGRPLAQSRADCALPLPSSLPGGTTGNKKQHSGSSCRNSDSRYSLTSRSSPPNETAAPPSGPPSRR